ncbi:cell division protein FtsQ/DivIB [Christiangramia sp. OXR-203]|uniref:cell division protein FtsQ/DivIB n=1 Tax=Christiangramia sp. OXR-203 TaxID=3100176 RepID=UPI002AC971DD|nr:cell division protein FtsQ/DivIB [Christiangramia sp. OXR-203]WPY99200.1 cell division protein FtsQ/DivIB [Christiangramia sp. OXR-203]
MKRSLKFIQPLILILLIGGLYGFAEHRHKNRKLTNIKVSFTETENLYVTEEVVNKLLIQSNDSVSSIDKETLDLNRVEAMLNDHDMIENAEVFLTLDGKLKATVSQRKPIGRVAGNSSFYLDRNGEIMPLSEYYSARVPLMFGFDGSTVAEVYGIVSYIQNDDFLRKHITGITRLNAEAYALELREDDFQIYFGDTTEIDLKFNNFKAFYKKATKEKKLNTYKKVNLQFGDQVVCTKK